MGLAVLESLARGFLESAAKAGVAIGPIAMVSASNDDSVFLK
jgi:hypothetical protein